MTDLEVVCNFMESRPKHITDHGIMSVGLWWWMGDKVWEPIVPDLEQLHEVEERLTDEQWTEYERHARWWIFGGVINSLPRLLLHATAEQKITALAAALRGAR